MHESDLSPLALNCCLLELECAILLFITLHLWKHGGLSILSLSLSEIKTLNKQNVYDAGTHSQWKGGQACAVIHGSELPSAYVSFSH